MTKRNGVFPNVISKKFKVDDNLDDLWGEDPNIDDIDDCLLLASQAQSETESLNCTQLNNVSIIPNYSLFKQNDNNLFTSTQRDEANDNCGTSNFVKPYSNYGNKASVLNGKLHTNHNESVKDLEKKVQELKDKYESKEGEVTILRSQLKEVKITSEAEYQKKEKEWMDKVNSSSKEINSIKSQLEFKNLEFLNLKNKMQEICKVYAIENGLNNSFTMEKQCNINVSALINYKIEPYLDTRRPLIETISPTIFKYGQPENFFNFKVNQSEYMNMDASLKNIENKHHKFDNILPDISVIVTADLQYINSEYCRHHIDQIVTTSHNILLDFYSYLSNSDCNIQKENIKQIYDDQHLDITVFDPRAVHNKEIGIKARQTVAVLAEILSCSSYLQSSFLNFTEGNNNCKNYLNLILMIVTLIRLKKRESICQGFLCAVAMLSFRISQTKKFDTCYAFILSIVKEVAFATPSSIVTKNLTLFFKQASINADFVKELCQVSGPAVKIEKKVYSPENTCLLQMFIVSYKTHFLNKENTNTVVNLNALKFVMNLLNCDPSWLHYQENKHCECLCEISRLGINVIHDFVKRFKNDNKKITCSDQYNDFLKCSVKVLQIINSKYFEIINKYPIDSEYKFIIKSLSSVKNDINMSEYDYEILRELITQEDVSNINVSFDAIPLWK